MLKNKGKMKGCKKKQSSPAFDFSSVLPSTLLYSCVTLSAMPSAMFTLLCLSSYLVPVLSYHILPSPIPCPALPFPSFPCPALPRLAVPCHAVPFPALPCPALPYRALSHVLPFSALHCPALACRALSCPTLPCLALLCRAHPCHVLSCPALPDPALFSSCLALHCNACPALASFALSGSPLHHTPFAPTFRLALAFAIHTLPPFDVPYNLPLPCPSPYRLLGHSPALQLLLQHQSFCAASEYAPCLN